MTPAVQTSGNGDSLHARRRGPAPGRDPTDRLPPHSLAAEQGVLGCVLLDPPRLAQCAERFGAAEVFYDLRHDRIYRTLGRLQDTGTPADLITVSQALKDAGELESIGGLAYLSTLPDCVPLADNLDHYLDLVWEKFLLRKMLRTLVECAQSIYNHAGTVPDLLNAIEAAVLAVSPIAGATEAQSLRVLVPKVMENIETMRRGVGVISGIRTHLGHLDKYTAGLHKEHLIVVAARPGIGKTSLGLTMARNLAALEKVPVGFFSMEMSAEELTHRLLCAEAGVNGQHLRMGFPSHEEIASMCQAAPLVAGTPVYIDDTPNLAVATLRAKARRLRQRFHAGLIVVDYFQLMHGARPDNRVEDLTEVSHQLKAMARELKVPVVLLAQLNRETVKNKHLKPQLSELAWCGALEQDADTVLLLYRPKAAMDQEQAQDPPAQNWRINALIAKQRHGPSDWDSELVFLRPFSRFEDAYDNRGKELPENNEQP